MKIAVLTYSSNDYSKITKFLEPNIKSYCDSKGYDFIIEKDIELSDREKEWSKWYAIQKHLSNYDWIFWIDADVMIIDNNVSLEKYINDFSFTKNVIIGNLVLKRNVGSYNRLLHTGAFLIKNDPRSFELINRMINADKNLKVIFNDNDTMTLDEGYLYQLFNNDPYIQSMFTLIPVTLLTSVFRQNHPIFFTAHFAGMNPMDKKLNCMIRFKKRFFGDGLTYINKMTYEDFYRTEICWDDLYNYNKDYKNPVFSYGFLNDIDRAIDKKRLSKFVLRTSNINTTNLELLKSFKEIILVFDKNKNFMIRENLEILYENSINFSIEYVYDNRDDLITLFDVFYKQLEIGINLLGYPRESVFTGFCNDQLYFDCHKHKMIVDDKEENTFMGWVKIV